MVSWQSCSTLYGHGYRRCRLWHGSNSIFKFFGPEAFGLFKESKKDSAFIALSGGNGISYPLCNVGKYPRYAMSVRYTREITNGRETIMFFWHGLHWKNGKAIRMIEDNIKVSEHVARTQCQHSLWEMTTEVRNILAFWENNHKID